MQVIPAIDVLDSKAVRLRKGRYEDVTVYHDHPAELARAWAQSCERLHVVDLEGARAGSPVQRDLIRQLVESDLAFDPCPLIREGMMVEVAHGPLKGVVGRLTRKNEKARLVLSVDLIGQAVSVEVDAADVKAY